MTKSEKRHKRKIRQKKKEEKKKFKMRQKREKSLADLERDLAQVDGKSIILVVRVQIATERWDTKEEEFYRASYEGILTGTENNGQYIILTDSLLDQNVIFKIKKSKIIEYQRKN